MKPQPHRTYCLATPPGRGAIATVLADGPDVANVARRFFRPAGSRPAGSRPADDLPLRRIVFGTWTSDAGAEELVVCRTALERVEIHCHGGKAAVRAVMRSLDGAGFREIAWRDALSTQDGDPIRSAALSALAEARTERTAAILLHQYHGALRTALERIAESARNGRVDETAGGLQSLEDRAELGRHLTVPWRVVLAGPANVGKSSLVNALLGYRRAIVFDRSGTTRDAVTATTALDGWPVELIDTAGFPGEPAGAAGEPAGAAGDPLETSSTAQTLRKLEEADAVVWVFEAGLHGPEQVQASIEAHQPAKESRRVVVCNKCDRSKEPDDARLPWLRTSATEGTGISELVARIARTLVPVAPAAEAAIPFTECQRRAIHQARSAAVQRDLTAVAPRLEMLLSVGNCDADTK